jgi:hypothetical protein
VASARSHLSDGSDDERAGGNAELREELARQVSRPEAARIHDRRVDRPGAAQLPGDRAVRERESGGAAHQTARDEVRPDVRQVVKGPGEDGRGTADGGGRQKVVVREVAVDDVEALAAKSLPEAADVPDVVEGSARPREQRPGPPEGKEAAGERAVADEAELRLDAGRDERRGLIVDDGGDAGPFLSGDELEEAHEKKLSAVSHPLRTENRSLIPLHFG